MSRPYRIERRRLFALLCVLVLLRPVAGVGVALGAGGENAVAGVHTCSSECTPDTCPMRRHHEQNKSAPYGIGECRHDTQLASTVLAQMPALPPSRIDTTPRLASDSMKRDAFEAASDHVESPPPFPPWA